MAEIIAFYGSPGGGKTTLALKTAMHNYMNTNKDEYSLFLSPDITVPTIALLFPNYEPEEIFTLGSIIDRPDITRDILTKNVVTAKNMPNLGLIGYKAGDGRYSYPLLDDDKVTELFETLSSIAEYIFVDCSNDCTDKISRRALEIADVIFRVISADPKGMAWYGSDRTISEEGRSIYNVVCNLDKDIFLATEEVCSELKGVLAITPYSRGARQQMIDGRLHESLNDRKYAKKLDLLISKI